LDFAGADDFATGFALRSFRHQDWRKRLSRMRIEEETGEAETWFS
jgi:hypothetical protein